MANERTFLAWMRTSLTFVTIGVGVAQLYRLEVKSATAVVHGTTYHLDTDEQSRTIRAIGKPLSTLCVVLGLCTLTIGVIRFYRTQFLLSKDVYPATRIGVGILVAIMLAMVVLSLVLVVKASL